MKKIFKWWLISALILIVVVFAFSGNGQNDLTTEASSSALVKNTEQVPVKKFASIYDYFEQSNNYPPDDGQSVFVNENTFIVKPEILVNSDDEIIKSDIKYAFFDSVFRVFAQTDVDEIHLSIEPQYAEIGNTSNRPSTELKKYNLKVDASRSETLEVLKKYADIHSFDEFIDTTGENEQTFIGDYKGAMSSIKYAELRSDNEKSWTLIEALSNK